ncbi:MAG: hypothetical protein WD489_07500 [Rhodovibrionaceae bacterium]
MASAEPFSDRHVPRGKRQHKREARRHRHPRSGLRHLSTILLSAGFALALLGAAMPRLFAAAQVAEYGTLSERLGRQQLDGAELSRAIGDHRDALRWFEDGRTRGDLGQIYFAAGRLYLDDPLRRRALLLQAAEQDREALSRDPGQPFLWTQLAVALAQTQGMGEDFRRVLHQSIVVAPRTQRLIFVRADLGLRAWPLLDAATQELVTGQIVQAVEQDPPRFRRSIPGPNHRRLVRHLLAVENPELIDRFLRQ